MATITSTELEVYLGSTSSGGTLVGHKITEQDAPNSICMNLSTLGVELSPGTQYCCRARCTNSEQYTTDWTLDRAFKTLILAELGTLTGNCGNLYMCDGVLTYNIQNFLSSCGLILKTSENDPNPLTVTMTEADFTDTQDVTLIPDSGTLAENTTYYVLPWATDVDGRTYTGAWADRESVNTGFLPPTVSINNASATYNSISFNVTLGSSTTIGFAQIDIRPTGGGQAWKKSILTSTGVQAITLTSGDQMDSTLPAGGSTTLTLNPSTEYRITVTSYNTGGGVSCQTVQTLTITTSQQQTATISISGITNITPTSACATLAYGDNNGQSQQVGEQNE